MANELQNRKGFWPRFVWVLILNPREFSHNARQVLLVARVSFLSLSVGYLSNDVHFRTRLLKLAIEKYYLAQVWS